MTSTEQRDIRTVARLRRRVAIMMVVVAAAAVTSAPAGATQPDCTVPGVDDKCELWAAVFNNLEVKDDWTGGSTITGTDRLDDMAVSPTGDRVFTLGSSTRNNPAGPHWWALVGTDAVTGDQRWMIKYPQNLYTLVDIAVSRDGQRVYVTGIKASGGRDGDGDPLVNTDIVIVAHRAATGEKLWERTVGVDPYGHRVGDEHNLHAGAAGVGLVVGRNDRVYVTGYADNRDTFFNLRVLAYQGASGKRIWADTYNRARPGVKYTDDRGLANLLALSPNGKALYLGAASCDGEEYNPQHKIQPCQFLLAGYRASDGKRYWLRQIGTGEYGWNGTTGRYGWDSTSLAVSPDGSQLYIGGHSGVTAYRATNGKRLWHKPLDGAAVAATKSLVVVSHSDGTTALAAATGRSKWSVGDDAMTPSAVAVNPRGTKVYVTGRIATDAPETPYDYTLDYLAGSNSPRQVTVAYDAASGAQIWAATYVRPPAQPSGYMIETARNGRVFVGSRQPYPVAQAGEPVVRNNESDWGVVAYAP